MNLLKSVLLVFSLNTLLLMPATSTAQASATDARVRELQQERVNVLQRAVDLSLVQYRQGALDFSAVRATQRDLLEAQLDMAETREERIRLLTSQLKIAKGSLAIAEARYRDASISVLDVHQAKSDALRIEIQLVKLQRVDRDQKPR